MATKSKKIKYSEPKNYIPSDIAKKYFSKKQAPKSKKK